MKLFPIIVAMVITGCTVHYDTPKTTQPCPECESCPTLYSSRGLDDIHFQIDAVTLLCKNDGACVSMQMASYFLINMLSYTSMTKQEEACMLKAFKGNCKNKYDGRVCNWQQVNQLYEYCLGN